MLAEERFESSLIIKYNQFENIKEIKNQKM